MNIMSLIQIDFSGFFRFMDRLNYTQRRTLLRSSKVESSPSEALISISLALSKTSAYTLPDHWYGANASRTVQLLLALIAPTHGGMARLSWPGDWLHRPIEMVHPPAEGHPSKY